MNREARPTHTIIWAAGWVVLLSGCLQTSPGSDTLDENLDGGEWQSGDSFLMRRADFPDGHDWMLIEVTANQTNPPSLGFSGRWQEHQGVTSNVDEGEVNEPEEFRTVCFIMWWGSEPGRGGHFFGHRSPDPSYRVAANDDSANFDWQLNASASSSNFEFNGFRPDSLDEDGHGWFLLGLNLLNNPREEDRVEWNLESDEEFQWRAVASGRLQCGAGPEDFDQGDYHAFAIHGRPATIADGLRKTFTYDAGGMLWVLASSSQGFTAVVENDDGLHWSESYAAESLEPSATSRIWWVTDSSNWTFGLDDYLDVGGSNTAGYLALDGIPFDVAHLAAKDFTANEF